MLARFCCTLTAATVSLLGCSQPNPSTDAASDATAQLELATFWKTYEELGKKGDAPALAALHTDSVTITLTGAPDFKGRAAFQAFLTDILKTTTYSQIVITPERQWIHGARAYQFGIFHEAYQATGKNPQVVYGRFAVALVQDQQRTWRIDDLVGIVDSTVPH